MKILEKCNNCDRIFRYQKSFDKHRKSCKVNNNIGNLPMLGAHALQAINTESLLMVDIEGISMWRDYGRSELTNNG